MEPSLYQTLPVIALAGFVAAGFLVCLRPSAGTAPSAWMLPAGLAAMFLAWSAFTLAGQGLAGVWAEHTRNAWGNQIWFDLLLAVGCAFVLLAPRARAAGMRLVPWFVIIACTGCIGLMAMLARCMFLEMRAANAAAAPGMRSVRA